MRTGVVGTVGDHNLAGQGLAPGADPDLPVDLALPKGVALAEILADEILTGIQRRLDLVERSRRGAPEEQIGQRDFPAVSDFQPLVQFTKVAGKIDGRVILLRPVRRG